MERRPTGAALQMLIHISVREHFRRAMLRWTPMALREEAVRLRGSTDDPPAER